jgi:hypothetical protein
MRQVVWFGVLAVALASVRADSQTLPHGTWTGEYTCLQGSTALELVLQPAKDATSLRGWFHFRSTPTNPGVPEGCFEMAGQFDPAGRQLSLLAGRWLRQPPGYVTVDLKGELDVPGTALSGSVVAIGCASFALRLARRDTALPDACIGAATAAAPGPH